MAFDFASVGDVSSWAGGMTQPVRPVTDLSPHVSGGAKGVTQGTIASGSNPQGKSVLVDSAIIVGIALAFLWITGALALHTHNL